MENANVDVGGESVNGAAPVPPETEAPEFLDLVLDLGLSTDGETIGNVSVGVQLRRTTFVGFAEGVTSVGPAVLLPLIQTLIAARWPRAATDDRLEDLREAMVGLVNLARPTPPIV